MRAEATAVLTPKRLKYSAVLSANIFSSSTTDIPILFISARSSDDDKIAALSIGGDDYIQKPYSLGVLLAKVKVMLKRFGQA